MKIRISLLCILLSVTAVLCGCAKDVPIPEKVSVHTVEPPADIDDFEIADYLDLKHTLRVGDDGKFRVLVLSDIQSTGEKLDEFIKNNIRVLVDRENPDLVLFSGDNSFNIGSEEELYSYLSDMVGYIEERQIPWAHVYGNHDDENHALDKEKQQKVYESFEYCVSRTDEKDVYGIGNYVLPVLSADGESVAFNVFAFDSGSYLPEADRLAMIPDTGVYSGYYSGTYDYIRESQVQWYEYTSEKMEEYYGKSIPAIAYFHIPLQENHLAWSNRGSLGYEGEKREYITASPISSTLFSSMLERGDVKAIVTGHDHTNDYAIEYRGIKLCSAATVGNHFYYDDDMLGGRVLVFDESSSESVSTYMSYIGEHEGALTEPIASISSGNVLDFEADSRYAVTALYGSREDYQRYYELKHGIFEDKGVGGSRAFGVTREKYNGIYSQNTIECNIDLDSVGSIGDNRYLRVYMDLTGDTSSIDFGSAQIGVTVDKQRGAPHVTSSLGGYSEFYYLADGSNTWQTYTMIGGSFGKDADVSVEGLCGWFVFSLDDLFQVHTKTPIGANDRITGFYILFTLADESMAGEYVYIDDVALVSDYKLFD